MLSGTALLCYITSRRNFDLFNPLSFVLLNVLLGMTFRSLFVLVNPGNKIVQWKLLIDQNLDFFVVPSIYMLMGVIFLILGYSVKLKRFDIFSVQFLRKDIWRKFNFTLTLVLIVVLAILAGVQFLHKMGVESLTISSFSKKRFLEIGGKKAALGYLRLIVGFLKIGFLFYLARHLRLNRKFLSLRGFVLIVTFLLALLFPIMTNSRGGVVLTILSALMIWYYLRGFSIKALMISFILSLFLIVALTLSRQNRITSATEIRGDVSHKYFAETVLAARHYLGVTKTAHIIEAVPRELPFAYGSTMFGWLVAPIPRAYWPEKPNIGLGPTIVEKALHGDYSRNGGVPPGLMGELYWNFGLPGIIFGMFGFGLLLKLVYTSCIPYLRSNINILLLYSSFSISIAFHLTATSVNGGMLWLLKDIVPILFFIFLFRLRFK